MLSSMQWQVIWWWYPVLGPMSRWQCCIVCGPGAQVPAAAPILPIKIRGPDWAVFWLPAVVSTSKHQIGRMQLSQQKLSCGHREIWFRQSHNSHCKTILKATQQCTMYVEKEKRWTAWRHGYTTCYLVGELRTKCLLSSANVIDKAS